MEKSKLGIAKELLAAGIFVGALAGGYVFAGLMVLYVLLKEDVQMALKVNRRISGFNKLSTFRRRSFAAALNDKNRHSEDEVK